MSRFVPAWKDGGGVVKPPKPPQYLYFVVVESLLDGVHVRHPIALLSPDIGAARRLALSGAATARPGAAASVLAAYRVADDLVRTAARFLP